MLAFTAGRLFTPTDTIEHPVVLVEHGRVVAIFDRSRGEPPPGVAISDFGDGIIAPGYVDLHIHGNAGYDVMDDSAEALPAIEQMLARHGVTSYFPTTVTAPMDKTLRALERLADAIENREEKNADHKDRALPLGIHIEGPFISHARRGVCVSLGHSDADFDTTERGILAGATHATHTFNAMRPLDHRSPGILGAVLTDRRLSADIIADGVHLDPAIVKLFANAKGPEQTVLITDAISATGMPDGHYRLGAFEVDV